MPEVAGHEWREDRYGFLRWLVLPAEPWKAWWDRIYVDPDLKQRILAYADFCLRHRGEYEPVGLPVHGILLLHGPPGTGKSSLARGLAETVAEGLARDGVADQLIFAEVDPNALPSQMLGESQRNVIDLLEKSLPELAAKGHPVIVVIDEVDGLVTRRDMTTGGRDPIDVMRATEAALRGVDYLASASPNVLVVATSNFVEAIDEAMFDRIDLAAEIGLPSEDRIEEILRDTLDEVHASDVSDADLASLAGRLVGRSGRDIRKLVLEALVTRGGDPGRPLSHQDITTVIERPEQKGRAR